MRTAFLRVASSLLFASLTGVALAQSAPEVPASPALAHAVGTAIVTQPANLMLIAVERVFEGDSFSVLLPQSVGFRADLLAGLKELGDQASLRLVVNLEQSTPPRIVATGSIAINFGPLLGQTDGELALAKAVDEVSALCNQLGATTGAITYELADDTSIRQEAVRQATENAFLPADSVARALRADLFTVDEVRVKSLVVRSGSGAPSATNPVPSGRDVTCEAEVEVTYLLADRS